MLLTTNREKQCFLCNSDKLRPDFQRPEIPAPSAQPRPPRDRPLRSRSLRKPKAKTRYQAPLGNAILEALLLAQLRPQSSKQSFEMCVTKQSLVTSTRVHEYTSTRVHEYLIKRNYEPITTGD